MCAVFGVLVIGLPIPIIGSSFNNFYAREKRREKMTLERAKQETAVLAARSTENIFSIKKTEIFSSQARPGGANRDGVQPGGEEDESLTRREREREADRECTVITN